MNEPSLLLQTRVEEKENRLQQINIQIEDLNNNIFELTKTITQSKNDITSFKNANTLYKYLETASKTDRILSNNQIDENISLNDEHIEIIKNLKNKIFPLANEATLLLEQQKELENRLFLMREECDHLNLIIFQDKEQIRTTSIENNLILMNINLLKEQLIERTNEIRSLEQLRREVENSLNSIKDKALICNNNDGGRLDLEKNIISLQSQIQTFENEIFILNNRITQLKNLENEQIKNNEIQEKNHNLIVDWKSEQIELKNQLENLLNEIKEQKNILNIKEKNNIKEINELDKYLPLIKKWKSQLNIIKVPTESLEVLWKDLNNLIIQNNSNNQNLEKKLIDIVNKNEKLQKELDRKKNYLDRIISQFHFEENLNYKQLEEEKEFYLKEEINLLKKIKELKLKVAQNYLLIK